MTFCSHVRKVIEGLGYRVDKLNDSWHILEGDSILLSNRSLGDLLTEASRYLGIDWEVV